MNKKKKILYISIIFIFVIMAFIIGIHHEPWADEAHAWLIARDSTFQTLFFKYLHTDGHPALWHLILKFFMSIGLTYKYLFIIPIIFSTIGISIFLFKSKFPWFIKILFPFTYFIFYQYTIIARGYCLILPLLALIATIWDKRHEKCFLFTFLLILLTNTEAYTYILSGFIYLTFIYEFFKNRKNIKNKKEHIISIIILTISFIITLLYVYPIPSNTFNPTGFPLLISDTLFTNLKMSPLIRIIISFILIIFLAICYKKENNKYNFIQFLMFILPIILFFIIKYYNLWHLGIIYLVLIFCFWIHNMENNKLVIILLLFTFIIQTYYSISSSIYDYKNTYSPAKEATKFIKKYNTKNIYGLSFNESAINPYFKKNIYKNWDKDIGFFYWNKKSKYYKQKINEKYMLSHNLDIVVTSNFYKKLNDKLLKSKYNIYEFNGYSYFENFKYEDQTIKIYVLKK